MDVIWMAIIGLIAGALAKAVMPGKDPGGWFVTMLLGIFGAVLAGMLGRAIGWYRPGESAGFIAAVVGAVIILWLYRVWMRRSGSTPLTH